MNKKLTAVGKLLRQAIDEGATFGDFLELYAAANTERDKALIAKARAQHHREGEVEIDDTTICSGTEDEGDYVLAWVWVDGPTA